MHIQVLLRMLRVSPWLSCRLAAAAGTATTCAATSSAVLSRPARVPAALSTTALVSASTIVAAIATIISRSMRVVVRQPGEGGDGDDLADAMHVHGVQGMRRVPPHLVTTATCTATDPRQQSARALSFPGRRQ